MTLRLTSSLGAVSLMKTRCEWRSAIEHAIMKIYVKSSIGVNNINSSSMRPFGYLVARPTLVPRREAASCAKIYTTNGKLCQNNASLQRSMYGLYLIPQPLSREPTGVVSLIVMVLSRSDSLELSIRIWWLIDIIIVSLLLNATTTTQ